MTIPEVTMKILVDNGAAPGLLAEHGFSLWVEADNKKILFDTGQGSALRHNAQAMHVELDKTELLILSHGHYDHTGGLPDVLHPLRHIHLYCHAAAFLPRYSISEGIAKPVKMMPQSMISVNSLPEDKVHWVTKSLQITDYIGITGEIPRTNNFETTGGAFYFDRDGKRADPIRDDMAFWIKIGQGLVVCIGCCHAGIINTLQYIIKLTGEKRIHTLIGGLHLLNAQEEQLHRVITELKQFDIKTIIPCHCTGDRAYAELATECNCIKGYAGMEISI